jgi:hypothetical protein
MKKQMLFILCFLMIAIVPILLLGKKKVIDLEIKTNKTIIKEDEYIDITIINPQKKMIQFLRISLEYFDEKSDTNWREIVPNIYSRYKKFKLTKEELIKRKKTHPNSDSKYYVIPTIKSGLFYSSDKKIKQKFLCCWHSGKRYRLALYYKENDDESKIIYSNEFEINK